MEKYCDLCGNNLIENRNVRLSSFLCDSCIKELYGVEKTTVGIIRIILEDILFVAINLFMVSGLLKDFRNSSFKQLIFNGDFILLLIGFSLGIITFIVLAAEYFIGRNKNEKL